MTPTQADREAAADYLTQCGDGLRAFNVHSGNVEECFGVSPLAQAFTRHRLAAEAAAFEKAAGVPLQISGLIGATSGSSIDSALREASEAIRKLAGEKHD